MLWVCKSTGIDLRLSSRNSLAKDQLDQGVNIPSKRIFYVLTSRKALVVESYTMAGQESQLGMIDSHNSSFIRGDLTNEVLAMSMSRCGDMKVCHSELMGRKVAYTINTKYLHALTSLISWFSSDHKAYFSPKSCVNRFRRPRQALSSVGMGASMGANMAVTKVCCAAYRYTLCAKECVNTSLASAASFINHIRAFCALWIVNDPFCLFLYTHCDTNPLHSPAESSEICLSHADSSSPNGYTEEELAVQTKSPIAGYLNMAKTMIGAGILALPSAFNKVLL